MVIIDRRRLVRAASPQYVNTVLACAWPVFILMLTGCAAGRITRYRLINVGGTAVTPDTRPLVPLDGSPFILFIFIFFISADGFTHALHALLHARTYIYTLSRTHAHTHAYGRPSLRVRFCTHTFTWARAFHCECVCVSRRFLISLSGLYGLSLIIHTTTAIVLSRVVTAVRAVHVVRVRNSAVRRVLFAVYVQSR